MIDLGNVVHLAIMAVPGSRGTFRQQAEELFDQVACIVSRQAKPLVPTTMVVFLQESADEPECSEIIFDRFGFSSPATVFVVQPPCCGAALGVELWALGGPDITVRHFNPQLLSVESDGVRWIHCGGIRAAPEAVGPYAEALSAFDRLQQQLSLAGVGFDQVVRTWIYINGITDNTDGQQRYHELNRARTDFYEPIRFGSTLRAPWAPECIYPASTGIGTQGPDIRMTCIALDTKRSDVFLLPLENPLQTPAYNYQSKYSPQTPKFSRAMALVQGHFVTTLVSGTASIVNAKTCHPGDIIRQTEQTIENIARLIAPENFTRHGLPGAGATVRDLAALRVYVKYGSDYEACRSVCERLLPPVPAIYLVADICRSDLLVEIEAIALSPMT